MTMESAIRRIELLAETADRMHLEAKQRSLHKYAQEWETKRNTLEGVLKILREEPGFVEV